MEPWAERIRPFGALDNVACKVSGMVTEADWDAWRPSDLAPYVDHVVEVFGPERLLFGSDWPVCLLAASYERVLAATREALGGLGDADIAAVLGRDARPRSTASADRPAASGPTGAASTGPGP